MCFAIPVQINKILPGGQAEIKQANAKMVISVKLVPKVKVGDWVLTQANLATEKISSKEAREVLAYFATNSVD